jgi:drug/metabolite transporter (DMT)-like permease
MTPDLRRERFTNEGVRRGPFGPVEWLLVLGVALIWGSTNFWIEIALRGMRPGAIVFARLAIGVAVLAVVPGTRSALPRAAWPRVALLGVLWMAVPLSLFPIAQVTVSSSLAGLLTGSLPLFATAVAALMLRRLPGRRQVLGLAVGFGGVVVVIAPSVTVGGGQLAGALLVVAAVTCYALSLALAVPLQQRFGGARVLLRAELVGLVLVAPWGLASLPGFEASPLTITAIVVLGVANTALAYLLMAALIGRVGAARGTVGTYLIPCVAFLLGIGVLGEELHPTAVVGLVLVVAGIAISGRGRAPARAAENGGDTTGAGTEDT